MRNKEESRTVDQQETFMTMLRRRRVAKGFTQEEFGRKVGASASTVSYWESGTWIPHPGRFPKIARVLGIDPLELTRLVQPEIASPGASSK